ncbi:hypothetical protein ACOSP7_008024 [Xanthoceras sorbifolium]|uniref:Nuclear nucleic acid-binding protein C1D n=1 Tax=Xanthoceras sorbifolium TaxID=99658 RepID=A0ABQ8IC55_9ROSI|nr:hypothetical protein JRO89_XS03G0243900 [Xanthoceras sorbifolium]
MEGSAKESKVIPDSVMDAVKKTQYNVEQVKTHLLEFLSLADPELLAEMPPLERARSLFLVAKASTVLYTLRLRCSGVHPDDHPVKSELERISLYQEKLQRLVDSSKEPSRPSTTLNYQAATRFIEHSLPDLTPDQRRSMKDVSRGEGPRIKYTERSVPKKRKFQSSERKTVQTAAKEFLEKASRELLGDAQGGFKGPIQIDDSDEEDHPMS